MRGPEPEPKAIADPCKTLASVTHRFVVDGHKGYVTVANENGRPVHVDILLAKEGGVLRGFLRALSIAVSIGLQHGVPLAKYTERLGGMDFEPKGWTRMGYAKSIVDYVFRWLARRFPEGEGL